MIENNVFPIPIMKTTVDEHVVDNTLRLVNDFVESTKFTTPSAPGELLTTFYKDKNFLGNLKDTALLDILNIKTREFFKIIGIDPTCFIEITSWLQYNQPKSYFIRHDHYGAIVSGVLYLQTPPNCGNLVFHNPLEQRRVTNVFFESVKKEQNDYNHDVVTYSPIKGELVMFESWLSHSVGQNLSDENRISVSFNVWAEKDGKC
jgi:hypothetical protein